MAKLVELGTAVSKLKAVNNCAKVAKQNSNDAMGLRSVLYLAEGAEVMITSNIWAEAGLHNGAKILVIYFVHQYANGPRNGDLPEAVVVQFCELQEDIQPFLPDIPITVAISFLSVEWINYNGQNRDGICKLKQVPLMLAYYFTIHKSQGKTLDRPVVNLGESENVMV